MSKGSLLSILGLYQADPTLFDNMDLPEGLDRETVIDAIIQDCMELEAVYTSPYAMKLMIGVWSRREQPTFERIYQAEQAEYNPIENYDRKQNDSREIKHSGDDVTIGSLEGTNTGNASEKSGVTTTGTGQVTENNLHKYAAFDSGDLADQTKDERTGNSSNSQSEQAESTQTHTDTSTENTQHTLKHGENVGETFTSYIHGNIGVTTSQQMLESELDLAPKINTINYVVNSFKMRFCILVY